MVAFKVTPEYVANAATSCDNTANEIQTQLAALKSYVTTLEAEYKGITATQFQTLMIDWDTYAQMLHNALIDIGSGLKGNYVNYTQTEDQNLANLRNINGVVLPGIKW